MFKRDYETKGAELIRLKGIGVVSAIKENFNESAEKMIKDDDFMQQDIVESGVFCLVSNELDIPF